MPFQLVEDAGGDVRNARFLAVASDLAYMPEAEGLEAFRSQLGLEARLVSAGNTQAYIGQNDDHIVVAFRGTEGPTNLDGLKDWLLTDAVNLLIVPEGRLGTDFAAAGVGAKFHQGFMRALTEIWDPIIQIVEAEMKRKERPLWITGHSLGGALALLAAWLCTRKFISVHQIYTFGAPMIGNAAASEAFDREFADKIYRYVNGPDPVPKLPTMSLIANAYGHCNKEMGIGVVTAVASGAAAASTLDFLQGMVSKTVDGVLNATLIDDIWNEIKQRVGAHSITNYRSLLEEDPKG